MEHSLANSITQLAKKVLYFIALMIPVITLLYLGIRYYHLHTDVICWFKQCTSPHALQQSLATARPYFQHQFEIYSKSVDRVSSNLSGLTYDTQKEQLIGIINSPPTIFILDKNGNALRQHPIIGANDTEGITYFGDNRIAILQEKRRSILFVDIPEQDHAPIVVDEANAFKLDLPEDKNNGPEGITYNAKTDTFYIVKERKPRGLYTIQGLLTNPKEAIQQDLSHYLNALDFASDLSGIAFDARNQCLLLLSDEAQMIIAIDLQGNFIDYFDLTLPFLTALPAPQPEGITIAPDGVIYVVSEPNLFYRLIPNTLTSPD